eukprot:12083615-Alexandrium_andersonii.AAC.1
MMSKLDAGVAEDNLIAELSQRSVEDGDDGDSDADGDAFEEGQEEEAGTEEQPELLEQPEQAEQPEQLKEAEEEEEEEQEEEQQPEVPPTQLQEESLVEAGFFDGFPDSQPLYTPPGPTEVDSQTQDDATEAPTPQLAADAHGIMAAVHAVAQAAAPAAPPLALTAAPSQQLQQQEAEEINSSTQRACYMRFMRRFSGARVGARYPELTAKFRDPTQRAALFKDFCKNDGDLNAIQLVHKRRHELKQKGKKLFTKMTKQDMMDKWHNDEDYVNKRFDEAVRMKRAKPDPYAPDDPSKTFYWVLNNESFELTEGLSLETELALQMEVADQDQLQSLVGDGGLLSAGSGLGTMDGNAMPLGVGLEAG